jgi:hypothetical protein
MVRNALSAHVVVGVMAALLGGRASAVSAACIQVVDTYAGRGADLALDAGGRPHISYSSYSSDLRYAFWTGSSWDTSVIPGASNVSEWHTSLWLGAEDTPHISYFTQAGALMHATAGDAGWTVEQVASTSGYSDVVHRSAIVADAAGQLHILYNDGYGKVREAYGGLGAWSSRVVASTSHGEFVSAAVGGDTLYAAYGSGFDLHLATSTAGGAWNATCLATVPLPWHMDVTIDRLGRPGISFADISYDLVMLARDTGAGWGIQTAAAMDSSFGTSLAFGPGNLPVVSFHCDDLPEGLHVARQDASGQWSRRAIDLGWATGWNSSLAIDSDGGTHLAYYGHHDLCYVYEPGAPVPEPLTALGLLLGVGASIGYVRGRLKK